jgi:hypothetical protein
MANQAFDRTIMNVRERPLSTDINQLQSQIDRVLRFYADKFLVGRASDSSDAYATPGTRFFGDSFKVRAQSPVSGVVNVTTGLGFFPNSSDIPTSIDSIVGLDDLERMKPLLLTATQSFTVPAADPTNPRIDIIEVKYDRQTTNPLSRDILDPNTGAFVSSTVDKTLSFLLDGQTGTVNDPASSTADISYKKGIAAAVPATPATSTGYVKIAEIKVAALATTFDDNVIVDTRRLLGPYGTLNFFVSFVTDAAGSPPTSVRTNAPPGVRIAVVNAVDVPDIYIIAGDLSSAVARASTTCEPPLLVASAFPGSSAVTNLVADSALQTLLVGATASPSTKIAIGQTVTRIRTSIMIGRPFLANPATEYQDALNVTGGPVTGVTVQANISMRYAY